MPWVPFRRRCGPRRPKPSPAPGVETRSGKPSVRWSRLRWLSGALSQSFDSLHLRRNRERDSGERIAVPPNLDISSISTLAVDSDERDERPIARAKEDGTICVSCTPRPVPVPAPGSVPATLNPCRLSTPPRHPSQAVSSASSAVSVRQSAGGEEATASGPGDTGPSGLNPSSSDPPSGVASSGQSSSPTRRHSIQENYTRPVYLITATNRKIHALAALDTQAGVNIMRKDIFTELGLDLEESDIALTPLHTSSASNVEIQPIGLVRNVDWHFGDEETRTYTADFYVVDTDQYDLLIGQSTLDRCRLINVAVPRVQVRTLD
ncbi:hypothetical protein ASPZODRAFT_895003 [Penicilliopsis zonata CBS 506.65]|uniref:Uncharacterized protein n=1 Tax=Penicilliopsis zonata CBS 506.65 TaxID=1073090 RepID=A0A1L9S8Q2_9EURO|nr:hypothetical protein ASPZODRAFT_895003 [Penicilliopsis zonata CBS 506.65]OJJ43535.1 hypothetical protein ASPZODRAFT_895003 [Penicilliopsis zonata CBS 506.65]